MSLRYVKDFMPTRAGALSVLPGHDRGTGGILEYIEGDEMGSGRREWFRWRSFGRSSTEISIFETGLSRP